MPAAYIHEQIAKKSLFSNSESAEFIKTNIEAFELGAQGPDILFFYNLLNVFKKNRKPNNLGIQIHQEKVHDFLQSILLFSKNISDASVCWVMGFLSHYAADTTIHPFVYASTNNKDGSTNTTKHLLLESNFDTWCYRKQGSNGIPRQVTCIKRLTLLQKKDIAMTLYLACDKVFPEFELSLKQVLHTMIDMKKIISLLYSPYKVKHYIYSLIEKIIGKPHIINRHALSHTLPEYDFLNMQKKAWHNPWNKSIVSSDSLPELFDKAADLSAKYADTAFDYINGDISLSDAMEVLGGRNFSSGLELRE